MLTPMPMSPDAGTQNITCLSVRPQILSGVAGPGTLVMTAVAFLANRPSSACCTGLISTPATDSSAKASSGWEAALRPFHRGRHGGGGLGRVGDTEGRTH